MRTLEVLRSVDSGDRAAIERLLAAAERADGRDPLSDQHRLDLTRGAGPGFAAVLARKNGEAIALAVVSQGNRSSSLELVVAPAHRGELETIGTEIGRAALDVVRHDGGGPVHWWVFDPTPVHEELARRLGLTSGRELLQMRRGLPTGLPTDLATRPFVPGADEEAWLDVNNRAFAGHPEQGGWTLETLQRREAEPWFDPAGFRLHERDGRLAGFCWTKLHLHERPPVGEIYVIGIDPDFQGLGLGHELTLAGLDSIAQRGVEIGMLYVDGANRPALAMYERLGFTVHRTDRAYTATL